VKPLIFTEEQDLLRQTARKFLDARSAPERVRELMDTGTGFAQDDWNEVAAMGWQAMAIPEEYGGAGYGWVEQSVLFEEHGRALFCAPYLSTVVLGASAVELAGSEEQRAELLGGVASGQRRLAVTAPADGVVGGAPVEVRGGALYGTARFVLDGHTADTLVVHAGTGGDESLYLVDGDADGLTREPMDVMDLTRKQATITLDGTQPSGRLEGAPARDVLEAVVTRAAVLLACESAGLSQRVLEMGVEYARTRKQFGRAIGSFQAIKHGLADVLVGTESAKSAAYHAARVLQEGDGEELAIAAPMAKARATQVAYEAAAYNIQVHGGIGFTWEHDAHLYFKRAKGAQLLFGVPSAWRARLADAVGF